MDDGGKVWYSVPISVGFYLKHVSCLAFSHLFIFVEIVCEQVEGLLCDEMWGLDGNFRGVIGGVSFGMRRGERRCFFT